MRIKEAINYALYNGKAINKKDLSLKLWPKSNEVTRAVNISNLLTGKTKTLSKEAVQIICKETGVDANFLFNIKPMKP